MVVATQDSTHTASLKATAFTHGQMEKPTTGIGSMASSMVMESTLGQTAGDMRVISVQETDAAKE